MSAAASIGSKLISGGKSQSEKSSPWQYAQSQLGGYSTNGQTANNQLSAMLSGNSAAAGEAFENYRNSAGYQAVLDAGSQAVSGSQATKGLLNSGGTAKSLSSYGQNLMSQYLSQYMGQLQSLSAQGESAAGTLSNMAFQRKNGTSSSSKSSSDSDTSSSMASAAMAVGKSLSSYFSPGSSS